MSSRRTAITALLISHLVGGAIAACFAAMADGLRPISLVIFLAVIMSQASLLGIWGGLAATAWWMRLVGVVIGTCYLAVEFWWGIKWYVPESFLFVSLAVIFVVAVTWMVRHLKSTVIGLYDAGRAGGREMLQFTIRHLMLLTFAVACLITIGKLVAPLMSGIDLVAELTVFAMCFAAVALVSIWAILGSGHPAFRSIFVVVIAALAGVAATFVIDGTDETWFWFSTTVMQAMLLIGSLWVMRSCGYRLVAKPRDQRGQDSLMGGPGASENKES